ncbi:hypothetical protein PR001_g22866 [Phytophthora rubi]|uniref:Uncharacterized protein n=1 Tax=Phytophthora rubi TaxID=129364 RepID=A0A6A3IUU7_9STRA|nr:hypothetical protein PR001_g22866 [Phytophthora rubi]
MAPKSTIEFNAQEAAANVDAAIRDRDLFLLGDGVADLASAGIVMPISSDRNDGILLPREPALESTIKPADVPPKVEPTTVETRTSTLEQYDQTSTSMDSVSVDGDVVSKVHNPEAECVLGTCMQSDCSRTAVKDDKCFEHCGFQKCSYPECTRNVWDTTMCFKHEGWRRNFMLQNH